MNRTHFRDTKKEIIESVCRGEKCFFKTSTPGPYSIGDTLSLRDRMVDRQCNLEIIQVEQIGRKEPVFVLGIRNPVTAPNARLKSLLTKWAKEIVRRDATGEGNFEDLANCSTDLREVIKSTQ